MPAARDLPELRLTPGRAVVRLPPDANVALTPRVQSIVNHPAFQRLRQVRQLGPTSLVYPGAVHTRFEHSLGVFHTATGYLNHLLEVESFASFIWSMGNMLKNIMMSTPRSMMLL